MRVFHVVLSCLLFCSRKTMISAVCSNLEAPLLGEFNRQLCKGQKDETLPRRKYSQPIDYPAAKTCTSMANISWLERPPLVYSGLANSSAIASVKKGIIPDVLQRAFEICCSRIDQNATALNYGPKERTLAGLHQQILRGPADIILPVHSARDGSYGGIDFLEFVEVLKSPGVVAIVDQDDQGLQESNVVLGVLSDTWPTILLAAILSAISGTFLWILEIAQNPEEFPRTFHRGAFNGFWWAFVTMSTVGYGDKVPRSTCGRIFAVIWIMVGMVICSNLTATLTSTFNKANTNAEFELTGKQIGAIEDTQAFYEAIKRGNKVTGFHNFQEMQQALLETKEIEAILEEIHPATYNLRLNSNNNRLNIVKYFESERRYGFVINKTRHPYLPRCVRSLIEDNQNDVFLLISRHLNKAKGITKRNKKSRLELLFDKHQITAIAGICFAVIIVCAMVLQLTYNFWKHLRGRSHKEVLHGTGPIHCKRAAAADHC